MNESSLNSEKLIGVEISKSALRAVSVNKNGDLIDFVSIATDAEQEFYPQLVSFINQLKTKFGNFEKIGIAVPGLIHQQSKRVAFSTFIPEHEKIDFLSELEAETGLSITIENDANAAAYGEFLLGSGRGSRNMFYATLGTGIGGALIFDGKIWRGASGFAGEFGHIIINSEGMKLEEVASAENIVRRTRKRFHQDHTSSLNKLREEQIKMADVIRAALKEDDFAQMMLERTGTYVGTAIANVINLLNIEKIVIGGDVMEAEHLILEAIIARARMLSFAPSFESTEIVAGQLGENSAAIGVALLSVSRNRDL